MIYHYIGLTLNRDLVLLSLEVKVRVRHLDMCNRYGFITALSAQCDVGKKSEIGHQKEIGYRASEITVSK